MITRYDLEPNEDQVFEYLINRDKKYKELLFDLLRTILSHQMLDINVNFILSREITKHELFLIVSYPGLEAPKNRIVYPDLYYKNDFTKNKIINDLRVIFDKLYNIESRVFDERKEMDYEIFYWTIEFSKTPRLLDYEILKTGTNRDDLSYEDKIVIKSKSKDFLIPVSIIETRVPGLYKKFIKPIRFKSSNYIDLRDFPNDVVQVLIDFLRMGTNPMLSKYRRNIQLILDANLFELLTYLEEPEIVKIIMNLLQDYMVEEYGNDPNSDEARDFRNQLRQYKDYIPVIPMINNFVKQFIPLAKYIDNNYHTHKNELLYELEINTELRTVKKLKTIITYNFTNLDPRVGQVTKRMVDDYRTSEVALELLDGLKHMGYTVLPSE